MGSSGSQVRMVRAIVTHLRNGNKSSAEFSEESSDFTKLLCCSSPYPSAIETCRIPGLFLGQDESRELKLLCMWKRKVTDEIRKKLVKSEGKKETERIDAPELFRQESLLQMVGLRATGDKNTA